MNNRSWIVTGFIVMGLAVAIGAFGAHLLADRLSDHYLDIYKTGVLYQFIHGLGLLITAMYFEKYPSANYRWIGTAFVVGLICFCCSLYIISFNEVLEMPGLRKFGAVAPIGGVAFIVAWALSAAALMKLPPS